MRKIRKRTLAWLFAGLLFGLLALIVVSDGLEGNVRITDPEGIPQTADAVMEALHIGDWAALARLVDGNTLLTPQTGEDGSTERMIWNAYLDSLTWESEDAYQVTGPYVTQRLQVTCLDIEGVTEAMAHAIPPSTQSPDKRQALLLSVAEQELHADAPTIVRQVTLTLIRKDGRWQVLPDNAFLSLLSGFLPSYQ